MFVPNFGDIPTWGLFIGAGLAAWQARGAFNQQSEQLKLLRRQVTGEQELTRQQADLLKLQAGQLELQRQQLDEQRPVNEKQIEVLGLQAEELRESTEERKRARLERRSAQASRMYFWEERDIEFHFTQDADPEKATYSGNVIARAVNYSDRAVFDLQIKWHKGSAAWGDFDVVPVLPPRERIEITRALPEGGLPSYANQKVWGAVLQFRDANGVTWLLRPDGELSEWPVSG